MTTESRVAIFSTVAGRTYLIGESNPYGCDPYYALYPDPPQSAGARLCRVLGCGVEEYLDRYERRNLLRGAGWSAPRARAAADALLLETTHRDKFVLLGAKVAAAFGCAFRSNLCAPRPMQLGAGAVLRARATLVLPRPSGLSRLWNEAGMADRVRAAARELDEATAVPQPCEDAPTTADTGRRRFDRCLHDAPARRVGRRRPMTQLSG